MAQRQRYAFQNETRKEKNKKTNVIAIIRSASIGFA